MRTLMPTWGVNAVYTVLLLLGVTVGTITLVMHFRAQACYRSAVQSEKEGAPWKITANWFENAAKSYVPGGNYQRRALEKLSAMAAGAQMRGNDEKALHLWEVVRRSTLSTRHVRIPNVDLLEKSEKQIGLLRTRRQVSGANDTPSPESFGERPDDPSPVGSILLFFSFLLWIAGAFAFIWSNQQRMRILYGSIGAVGLGGWVVLSALL